MLKTVIEKELKDIIGSKKFILTFTVSAILIILTFYVGARNYQVSRDRYEAAVSENIRQMEGLTDWLRIDHSIFLPPHPLTTLVTGVSNDIGRNINMYGRGELGADDSRFNNEPMLAIFRFLDLQFIFVIVLSLFAILLAYDSVCGEKERGTLRLTLANPVPRDTFILGKTLGSTLALGVPLLLSVLVGCLLLPLMGIPMAASDWFRLGLIILCGFLYFGAFLTLSVWISSRTLRSSAAFLSLLIIWIFSVLILPRSAVLVAGYSFDVLSSDAAAAQKSRLRAQLWNEDRHKLNAYKPGDIDDMQQVMNDFQQYMQDLANAREEKMGELAGRLQEQRSNEEAIRESFAFGLARVSPSATFSLAVMDLAGSSLELKQRYLDAAVSYQQSYAGFISEKTGGMVPGSGMVIFRHGDEEPPAIDPSELPVFSYTQPDIWELISKAMLDMAILVLFNLLFFAAAYVSFLKYDVR